MASYVINCCYCGIWIEDSGRPNSRAVCDDCRYVVDENKRHNERLRKEAEKELEKIRKRRIGHPR